MGVALLRHQEVSEDTAGLDMHGCGCSEVSMENGAGWLHLPWVRMCPFPLPYFHIPSPDSLLRQYQPMAPSQTHSGLSREEPWPGPGSQAPGRTQVSLTSCCSHFIPVILAFPPLVTPVGKLHPAPPILLIPPALLSLMLPSDPLGSSRDDDFAHSVNSTLWLFILALAL